jgi:hypothetical protein
VRATYRHLAAAMTATYEAVELDRGWACRLTVTSGAGGEPYVSYGRIYDEAYGAIADVEDRTRDLVEGDAAWTWVSEAA